MNKKYNLSKIMKNAWISWKKMQNWVGNLTFGECLRRAWAQAKEEIKTAEEAVTKGIRRMHYSEYKNNYSNCETVPSSYDTCTKTIEVMTRVRKNAIRNTFVNRANGICPRCGTYCYGDCSFR